MCHRLTTSWSALTPLVGSSRAARETRTQLRTSSSSKAHCRGWSAAHRANVAALGVASHRSRKPFRIAAMCATTVSSRPFLSCVVAISTPSSIAMSPPGAREGCARIASSDLSSANASSRLSFDSVAFKRVCVSARVAAHSVSPPNAAPGMAFSLSFCERSESTLHGGGKVSEMSRTVSSHSPRRCEHLERSRVHKRTSRCLVLFFVKSSSTSSASLSSLNSASYISRALLASPSSCAVRPAFVLEKLIPDVSNARDKQSRAAWSSPDARCKPARASQSLEDSEDCDLSFNGSVAVVFDVFAASLSALNTSARASKATTPEARHPASNAVPDTTSGSNSACGSKDATSSAHAARVPSTDATGSKFAIAKRTPSRSEFVLLKDAFESLPCAA